MADSDLLPGGELAARLQLEARKQKDADHAAGMVFVCGDGLANAEDRLAVTVGAEGRGGIAKGRCSGCGLFEKIEDANAILPVIAMHQAQEAAFRGAQPMQHGAPLPELDEAAGQVTCPAFGNAELREEIGILAVKRQRTGRERRGKICFGNFEQADPHHLSA